MTELLFAYGTLKPGLANFPQIARYVRSSRAAIAQGVLLDLGAFPALIPGQRLVRGVLLEVDAEALKITDRIEGYCEGRFDNLYNRVRTTVTLFDFSQPKAWTYEFAHPDQIADRPYCGVTHIGGVPVYEWPPPL